MVCSCSVHLCTNRSKPGGRKIHFFQFPLKNPSRAQQWIQAVGRKGFIPTQYSKVCSDHFIKDDFVNNVGSKLLKLKENAVPSIFPYYTSIIEIAKVQCLEKKEAVHSSQSQFPTESTSDSEKDYVLDLSKLPEPQLTPLKKQCCRPLFSSPSKHVIFSPMIRKLKTKVKQLQQKVRRQNKSIQNMKDLLKILKDKKLLANESEELLLEKLDSTTLELFQNISKNKGRKPTGYRYSKEIKEFALTLHYYSPKAYEYARSIFILANSKSIMNWTSSVNGEPGIFSEVMQALQNLNPPDKHFNLCFDAMSIRKQVIWSEKDNNYIGYCDFGNELQLEGINTEATEALFFMLISLNGRWYLNVRLKLFGKQYTASINTISERHKLNKLVLFSNH